MSADASIEPREEEPSRSPLRKILILAGICVVVLCLSLWGLVSAFGSGGLSETPEQSSDATGGSGEPDDAVSGRAASGALGAEDTASGSGLGAGSGSAAALPASSAQQADTTEGSSAPDSANAGGNTPALPSTSAPQAINVSLSVSCNEAVAAGSATALAVSDDGAMRYAGLRLDAGTTVYDALRLSGAVVGSNFSALGTYISSIDGLAEGEAGAQSGWKYYVNGTAPNVSCDKFVLSEGDTIEWRYVLQP